LAWSQSTPRIHARGILKLFVKKVGLHILFYFVKIHFMKRGVNVVNKTYLTPYAKALRQQGVLSEALMWNCLKGRKINNLKFTKQKVIGKYIVDFYCAELKLIIEIDGSTHDFKFEYDKEREKYLESFGYRIVKILDSEVKFNLADVVEWLKVELIPLA
jgi:very-short-patch-repair endonuclease